MFQAKTMQPSDFEYAAKLANTMDWKMAPEDFAYNSSLEPDGCLVLYDGSNLIGVATCISYGKTGWFGNLIIDPANRKKGAGTFLVRQAVKYLQKKGVESIGLYAYPSLVSFYGNIGFVPDIDFSVLHASQLNPIPLEPTPQITNQDFKKIVELDANCFGGNRERLLNSVILTKGNLSYRIPGEDCYIAAKVYEGMAEVGPLVCPPSRPDIAVKLLKAVLSNLSGSNVYMYMPKNQTILQEYLRSVGFVEKFYLTRMFLARNLSKNCIYIAESLERG